MQWSSRSPRFDRDPKSRPGRDVGHVCCQSEESSTPVPETVAGDARHMSHVGDTSHRWLSASHGMGT